ncbi:hypothetical protein [Yoonia sp. 208BN28-4]|uniref:hypothetical protein n=1 Tax=Yoonia sp. 208BN28-4 TaxID=3126505 RepID=UPI00309ED76A
MTKPSLPVLIAIPALMTLAACGGSNNGSAGDPMRDPGVNKPLLEALQNENAALFSAPQANLPPPGTTNYSGFAQIASDGSVVPAGEAVGRATLTATFGAPGSDVLSGRFYDFDDPTGTYDGELTVASTGLEQEQGRTVIDADVDGTLTRSTGEVITVDGALRNRLFGNGGTYMVGAGKASVESGTMTGGAEIFINVTAD